MRKMLAGGMLLVCWVAGLAQAGPLEQREERFLKARLVPAPQSVTFTDGPRVVLDGTLRVTIACATNGGSAVAETRRVFKEWFGHAPGIVPLPAGADGLPRKPDAYRIAASAGTLSIEAADSGGVRNALRTLRQLAEPLRGTREVEAYALPETRIEDAPAMAFRGFHICWFPENTPVEIERFIRLAAYYKMNYVVIEPWGMFVSGRRPGLAWPEAGMTRKAVRHLVKVADSLGVTLIPQFNVLGHASGARSCCHKHAVLDLNPALQPLFEPLGWSWCLSNPETVRLIEERVADLHEAFGRPPFFHAGCDEAEDMGTCSACRRTDYPARVRDYLTRLRDLLAARGCRMMIWHDMLLQAGDPRWKGFYANGKEYAEPLLQGLPRDIVICDWYYGAPNKEGTWPTLRYFKEKGFGVLSCPWEDLEGYRGLSQAVVSEGLDGMLSTTWHHLYGRGMMGIYFRAAHAMWGTRPSGGHETLVFAHHLRQVGWDVPVRTYEETGTYHTQLPAKTASPY
ncbi:MAG: glycoside hydrolase family 20 zincin-like fold domain-containing protein [Kiritimatiellia bacterium]|nr:glycoside hydrolase family 20 zincin-like fold domain-containing protein [Kiritimatiellia bacterium]